MGGAKSIYKLKDNGQRIRVFDFVIDAEGRITGIHFKSGRNSSIDEIISMEEINRQLKQNNVSES